MSSPYVDHKYIVQLGGYLEQFIEKKPGELWNFRCPICGDSEKSKIKARGYIFRKNNKYGFHCHDRGCKSSIGQLIQRVAPKLYQDYIMESFAESGKRTFIEKDTTVKISKKKKEIKDLGVPAISQLPFGHPARKYLSGRLIDPKFYDLLYFAEDFSEFVTKTVSDRYVGDIGSEPRIIIPFFDKKRNLIGAQGRSLQEKAKLRYVTVKVEQDDILIYGLDRWDEFKKTYVVEGPIDSLFLPNALATAGSDLKGIETRLGKSLPNAVFVFDNEPRNRSISILAEQVIERGHTICVFPASIQQKDINTMVIAGINVKNVIDENSFSGLKAKIKFGEFKKR